MNPMNPNNKWRLGFKPSNATANPLNPGGNLTPANHQSPGNTKATTAGSLRLPEGVSVQLPRHLYQPPGAQSFNLVSPTISVGAGATVPIMSFTAPQGAMTSVSSYAFTNNGGLLVRVDPQINGNRVLPYHGNPGQQYRMTTPTGPDLGNNFLVEARVTMKPGEVFTWTAINADAVAHDVSVRMVGYIISTQALEDVRFGG